MKRIVCDICKERNADRNFKVKQNKEVRRGGFIVYDWVEIDICPVCYRKLLDSVRTDNKDTICEYFVSLKFSDGTEKPVCYGTKDAEECFCKGQTCNCTHYPEKRKES